MKPSDKSLIAGAVAAAGVALAASSASAAIVCNAAGDCWHTHARYAYRPAWGLVVHPDSWRWGPADHFRWHEHRGRGYWRDGVWIRF
ncbi:MAG: hypothetical protein WDM92_01755 [Caulobacteraceae bacterium]